MACGYCNGTGWTRNGRCWMCNPRPTAEQMAIERRMNAAGAKNPERDAVRRALEQRRP